MSAAQSRVVADRYRLVEPLGQGGMGRVWMAKDELLHRDVAIKELVPPAGLTVEERQEMRERAMREARAIARLSHPNVVRIFDILRTDGDPWIVMEYVRSRSLQEVLAQDGALPPKRAAEIGLGMLAALRAAHRAGVVHRDIKPGNVLLGEHGRVVLTDFGLATIPGDPLVTRTGLVLGSPAYIAPERASDGTAGPAADMWSLGATLYAAVEGASPYARASAIATLTALATEPPAPARRAGPLKPVLSGLLRKDPAARIRPDEVERLLLRAAGRRARPAGSLLTGLRRASTQGRPSALRSAPMVAGVAAVPPPRRPEVEQAEVAAAVVEPVAEPGPPDGSQNSPQAASEPETPPEGGAAPAEPGDAEPAAQDEGADSAAQDEGADSAAQDEGAAEAVRASGPAVDHDEPARDGDIPPAPAIGAAPVVAVAPVAATKVQPTIEDRHDDPFGAEQQPVVEQWQDPVRPALLDRVRSLPVRHVAIIVAGIVALVVLLALVLSNEDRGAKPSGSALPSATSTTGPTAGPTKPATRTTPPAPATTPASGPTAAPTGPPAGQLPPGWRVYRHRTGFKVAVPRTWRIEEQGTIVYFREQTGQQRVLGIDRTDYPKPDPVKDWTRQEAERAHLKPNYQRVRIEKVDYFVAAADWEYEYDGSNGRLHAINRGFVTGPKQAHAILWITPDRTWEENLDEFKLIVDSFVPIP